jgi:hypothetical protein
VWCSFEFFQQSDAETIGAIVSDGRITTDIGENGRLRRTKESRRSSDFEIGGGGTRRYVGRLAQHHRPPLRPFPRLATRDMIDPLKLIDGMLFGATSVIRVSRQRMP